MDLVGRKRRSGGFLCGRLMAIGVKNGGSGLLSGSWAISGPALLSFAIVGVRVGASLAFSFAPSVVRVFASLVLLALLALLAGFLLWHFATIESLESARLRVIRSRSSPRS